MILTGPLDATAAHAVRAPLTAASEADGVVPASEDARLGLGDPGSGTRLPETGGTGRPTELDELPAWYTDPLPNGADAPTNGHGAARPPSNGHGVAAEARREPAASPRAAQ